MKPNWQQAEIFWSSFFSGSNGRRQPGSGNLAGKPGDVRYREQVKFAFENDALLESKQTDKNSLTLKQEWLEKISSEALHMGGRVPLVGLTIGQQHWLLVPCWAIEQESHAD